jgi:hypothetical protein
MNIRVFLGAAGTGKTFSLMGAIQERLSLRPLTGEERVLAITRMHGARSRLDERLGTTAARGRYDCLTLDRLAWLVSSRWRLRAAEMGLRLPASLDYDETCAAAAALLSHGDVSRWLVRQYPIVVVDEFQDLRGPRLAIVEGLASAAHLVVAADEFQDLQGDEESCPAVTWINESQAQGKAEVMRLEVVHRTRQADLLAAADSLRCGRPLNSGWGRSYSLVAAPNASVAASFLARNITWWKGRQLVVISPTGPDASPWVRGVLARLARGPFKSKGQSFGPHEVRWESSHAHLEKALAESLSLPEDPDAEVSGLKFKVAVNLPIQRRVEEWIRRQKSLRGAVRCSVRELGDIIKAAVQHNRAHARPFRGLRGMTVQQAKNQEFARVFVLWPLNVVSSGERKRRLLYNAITRAREAATVVVQQDPKAKDILQRAPFDCPAATEPS